MWTIIDKLSVFFLKFFYAVKFFVFDFDDEIRMKMLPWQRVLIWLIIVLITLLVGILLLTLLGSLISSILRSMAQVVYK